MAAITPTKQQLYIYTTLNTPTFLLLLLIIIIAICFVFGMHFVCARVFSLD